MGQTTNKETEMSASKTLLKTVNTPVSQREKLRADQVKNSAGGFVWEVDEWTQLRRFLILGSEGGSYYASEKSLTKDGINSIDRCLASDGIRLVDEIVRISHEGLAPKNDYALFALARAVAEGDLKTRQYALSKLNSVARIGTHLFQFAEYLNSFGSLTGRAKRRAFAKWYTDKSPDKLVYQVIKYRNRNNWTHRDILRVAHPGKRVSSGNPTVDVSSAHADILKWIANGSPVDENVRGQAQNDYNRQIIGFAMVQNASSAKDAANYIRTYNLPREAVPTQYLNDKEVWQALLDVDMPITALVRNLANMTRIGLLTSTSDATKTVIQKLKNDEAIKNSRIHPIALLFALKTYASGHGFRGSNSWTPVQTIVDALDGAFYKAFKNVEPTGKRILLALDVSGSMTWGGIAGTNISPREGSAAMALVTASVEDRYEIVGFSTELTHLNVSPRMRLDTVVNNISGLPFRGTDCALPMLYAKKKKLDFDAFVIYTDSETWFGNVHPAKALKDYRKSSGIEDAKLVVVGMVANKFSIADPSDAGMLDVVGFDSSAPQLINSFIRGEV